MPFRGGIRGIVELEILKHLEDALGCNIPVHAFFDLIVGTRLVHLTTWSSPRIS